MRVSAKSPAKAPSRRHQILLFARNFLKHPRMLGSLIPSSRFLIDRLLRAVDWQSARVLVEYGPGVGSFTAEVLRRMRPDATLIVFETNDEFVRFLRDSFRDPRLQIVHGSAAEVGSVLVRLDKGHADYVISGIPFTGMPPETARAILNATRAALGPRGAMLVYQFTGSVLPHLRRAFRFVHRDFEPLNILPAQLFYCTDDARDAGWAAQQSSAAA